MRCGNDLTSVPTKALTIDFSDYYGKCMSTIKAQPEYQVTINFTVLSNSEQECKFDYFDVFSENEEGMLLEKHGSYCSPNLRPITSVENVIILHMLHRSPYYENVSLHFYSGNKK